MEATALPILLCFSPVRFSQGTVTIIRKGRTVNFQPPLLYLAVVAVVVRVGSEHGCAGKLAVLGTCLIPLSSCTKVHALSLDGNIFWLLSTDFATWISS